MNGAKSFRSFGAPLQRYFLILFSIALSALIYHFEWHVQKKAVFQCFKRFEVTFRFVKKTLAFHHLNFYGG